MTIASQLSFPSNYKLGIDAIKIALGVIESPMKKLILAFFDFFLTVAFSFSEIILIYFIAEIIQHKTGHDDETDYPNYTF